VTVDPGPAVPPPGSPSVSSGAQSGFADGEWHRLHPATPFLRGGLTLFAIAGIVIVNLRDILLDSVFGGPGGPGSEGEPLVLLTESGFGGLALLGVLVVIVALVVGFYFSWRMHTFRITDEVVEVRSGILFRTHRRARLDRIQGINIQRPFLARLFGAAKLEVNVAGQDANVPLAYLGSLASDQLRREILVLASGTQRAEAAATTDPAALAALPLVAATPGPATGIVEQRVNELLAPELDPELAPRESVVSMHLGRLIGSLVLSETTVFLVLLIAGLAVVFARTGEFFFIAPLVPILLGTAGFYFSRFTKSLRYSIAGTPDGVRVGFGLFSTSNETLPPGRIHSVQVSQPLLWRAAGWWEIKLNRASTSAAKGAAGQANTTILPVGNLSDVRKVLELVLPALVDPESIALLERGLTSSGRTDDGFHNSPRRARLLRWFSWRRNGFALVPGAVLLRSGFVWRRLVVVPLARAQGVSLTQGPIERRLRLASVQVNTVAGPVSASLGAIDAPTAGRFFADAARSTIESASADTTHRWGSAAVTPASFPTSHFPDGAPA